MGMLRALRERMRNASAQTAELKQSASSSARAKELERLVEGGQFAAKSNPESEVDLADQSRPVMETRPDGTEQWRLNGKLHRDDGPARVFTDGSQEWWLNGNLHRDDGPAVTRPDGIEEWWQNGRRHREDGPARVFPDGTQMWYQNGHRHRDDGPAATRPDGTQIWYQNGTLHRDDGPAVTRADGRQEWWLNGHRIDPPDSPPSTEV